MGRVLQECWKSEPQPKGPTSNKPKLKDGTLIAWLRCLSLDTSKEQRPWIELCSFCEPWEAKCCGKIVTKIRSGIVLLLSELRGAQEIKIPRRIQPQIPYPVGMHHDIIEIPQIDVWQILRQNTLNLGIQRLAHL